MLPVVRVLIGVLFLVSGVEKLISPYQNFLYAIQAYQLLPGWAETAVARVFPWVELFVGIFMFLGLWTEAALKGALVLFAVFITVVGQALLRKLDIDQCGCFGQMMHLKLHVVIVLDSLCLFLTVLMLRYLHKTKQWGLDRYFEK